MHRIMTLIRHFDDTTKRLVETGEVQGAVHTSRGQEAVAAGVCLALEAGDVITTHHRSQGHLIAKGSEVECLMAEILGKRSGVCGGLGGSQHLSDPAVGAIAGSAVVGGSIPIAVGAGLASSLTDGTEVVVAFLGDGAATTGIYHESLNLAAIWRLPVIFVCENNGFAISVRNTDIIAGPGIAAHASSLGVASRSVDGQDVDAVFQAMRDAVDRARSGQGPIFVEIMTYRMEEHSFGVPARRSDRSIDELAGWLERDPVSLVRRRLIGETGADADELDRVETDAGRLVDAALARAREAPPASVDSLLRAVWARPVGTKTRGSGIESEEDDEGRAVRMTWMQAARSALRREMERDPRVIVLGQDVRASTAGVTAGLVDDFGDDRVRDTPISEAAVVGAALGGALRGLRVVVDLNIVSFAFPAMDQIVSHVAMARFLSGGRVSVPVVLLGTLFHRGAAGAQHASRPHAFFMGIPGLKTLAPCSPADAAGLLSTAIRDDDPVLILADPACHATEGEVPEVPSPLPYVPARIVRRGTDVTCLAIFTLHDVLEAAALLETEGISVEVVDPRSLAPFDDATVLESVARTGRLVVADIAHRPAGAAAEVVAMVAEDERDLLRTPPLRIAPPDIHVPYAPQLAGSFFPDVDDIAGAIRRVMSR